MSHPLWYTKRMMIKEHIFKVTFKLTPKATILRSMLVKARDEAHATRIVLAQGVRLGPLLVKRRGFSVVNAEFACEDNLK